MKLSKKKILAILCDAEKVFNETSFTKNNRSINYVTG